MRDIARISAATGLSEKNLEKEVRLFNFMPRFFNAMEEQGIKVALYGGTALNKGYFKEKQRFSKDLDIDVLEQDWHTTYEGIVRLLQQGFKEYVIERTNLNLPGTTKEIVLRYGQEPWETLLIELNVTLPAMPLEVKKIALHSLLEYHGMPMPGIYIPSYSLESLLARKMMALARRQIGKDIYDVYMGLKHNPDRKILRRYLDSLSKDEWKTDFESVAGNMVVWLEKTNRKSTDIVELSDNVPIDYREDIKTMVNEIAFGLRNL